MYTPDKWVILKDAEGSPHVMGGWYGGYLDGDSWRLSTVIKETKVEEDHVIFETASGSRYKCHSLNEGMSSYMIMILTQLQKKHTIQIDDEYMSNLFDRENFLKKENEQ
jgi:hypothetical protein